MRLIKIINNTKILKFQMKNQDFLRGKQRFQRLEIQSVDFNLVLY